MPEAPPAENPFLKRAREAMRVSREEASGIDRDRLAQALRAHNCRQHPETVRWPDVDEHVRSLWLEKADWIIAHMGRTGGDT